MYLSLSTSHGDVNETASVCDSLLRAALGGLLLLLLLDLGGLRLDLSGTCQRSVDLTHDGGWLRLTKAVFVRVKARLLGGKSWSVLVAFSKKRKCGGIERDGAAYSKYRQMQNVILTMGLMSLADSEDARLLLCRRK